ncbi:MAG TPA: hypothetical protein VFQ65_23635 [Kofleriaceae bacterium]|nr:hypothetical protein [Kofleriaceae bacterium]
MMIIYGHRSYGRVHGHGGEHAQTQFAHLYYMPLIPMSSFWVTSTHGGSVRGLDIKLSARSVIATYLRWWGPVAAALAFALAPGVLGAVIAAPVVVAVAAAWSWRSVRSARAIRHAEVDRIVFGTRCPPALLTVEKRQDLRRRLDERWSKIGGGRSPEDVVSFGPRSPEEALFAYGLLRLAAVDHRDPAAADGAERILAGIEREPTEGSPYRGDAGVAFVPPGLDDDDDGDDAGEASAGANDAPSDWNDRTLCTFGACVGVIGPGGACKTCGKRPGVDVESARPATPQHKAWWMAPVSAGMRFALIAALIWSVGLTVVGAASLLPVTKADSAFLARESKTSRYVEVACDRLELVGTFTDGAKMFACVTGDRLLPVVGAVESTTSATTLVGQLHEFSGEYVWPVEIVSNPAVTAGYLRAHSRSLRLLEQLAGVGGIAGLLAILAAVAVVAVRRRRAKRGA